MGDKHRQIVSCSRDVKGIHWVQNRVAGATSVKSVKLLYAKITKGLKRVLAQKSAKARVLARVIGQCVAMTKAVLAGKLLLRNAYRLLAQKTSWEEMLFLNPPTKAYLKWWDQALQSWNGSSFMPQSIDAQIETDASQTGWGAICNFMRPHSGRVFRIIGYPACHPIDGK